VWWFFNWPLALQETGCHPKETIMRLVSHAARVKNTSLVSSRAAGRGLSPLLEAGVGLQSFGDSIS